MEKHSDILFAELSGRYGDIGLMTLNRPSVLNALNHAMFNAMHQQLTKWQTQSSIKAVIVLATKGRAFSAGGDIRYAYEKKMANAADLPQFFLDEYQVNRQIFHYPKPYIALLNGLTMGGGAGISINGSHRVATENFQFAMPETGIGFFPDVGATYFLSHVPYYFGFYLGLSGEKISSEDCLKLGLIDYIIPVEAQTDLIQTLVNTPLPDKKNVTDIIQKFSTKNISSSPLFLQKDLIKSIFSKNTIEEIIKALTTSENIFAQKIGQVIQTKSPMSLKVTLKALQQGQLLNFDDCMQMESSMMMHFLQSHDFFEGIRAVVIDKDKNPNWQPNDLENISVAEVSRYFENS